MLAFSIFNIFSLLKLFKEFQFIINKILNILKLMKYNNKAINSKCLEVYWLDFLQIPLLFSVLIAKLRHSCYSIISFINLRVISYLLQNGLDFKNSDQPVLAGEILSKTGPYACSRTQVVSTVLMGHSLKLFCNIAALSCICLHLSR